MELISATKIILLGIPMQKLVTLVGWGGDYPIMGLAGTGCMSQSITSIEHT
jgi:hypothetical protein